MDLTAIATSSANAISSSTTGYLLTFSPIFFMVIGLAATFVVMAAGNATLYAVFADSARRRLSSSRAQRGFNLAGGSLLSAAGVWALLAKRVL